MTGNSGYFRILGGCSAADAAPDAQVRWPCPGDLSGVLLSTDPLGVVVTSTAPEGFLTVQVGTDGYPVQVGTDRPVPPLLSEQEQRVLAKARELARLSRLNAQFRGWDRDIDQLTSELVQLAKALKGGES